MKTICLTYKLPAGKPVGTDGMWDVVGKPLFSEVAKYENRDLCEV